VPTYQSVTLGFLISLLQGRLRNAQFWTLVELRTNLNEAISILQCGTLNWKERFRYTTQAGQMFVDLTAIPDDHGVTGRILMPLRVTFNGTPLDFATLTDMDEGVPYWQLQATGQKGVANRVQLWGNVGLSYMFIWPSDGQGGNGLGLDCAVRAPVFPTDGSGDKQFLNLDSSAVQALLGEAEFICAFKRGIGEVQRTMPKHVNFMRMIAETNAFFKASSVYKDQYAEQTDRKSRPRLVPDFTGSPTASRYR
jgi:hypothetical protein